jgi:DNA-binding CsgD family transcriptional regulator/tetratricopeptide (TPR) repeat protein
VPRQAAAHGRIAIPATLAAPRFTGRDRPLAALAAALGDPPAVVLVEGEAGIGKTRLIGEYLATAQGTARKALVATCPPFRQPHTLGPLADALRQATGGGVGGLRLSALGGALRPLFPEWAAGLPPTPEPTEDVTAGRHRVFAALAELLDCLETTVLVVEDVHWADEATVEFALFLATRQPRQVSLVVTYRPEDVPAGSLLPRLARLAVGTSGLQLALNALDVDATAELVSSMLAGEQVSAGFAGFIHERTGGVPLAVEESVRLMADRADLARRGGQWVRRSLTEITVPPSIRDAVLERVGRLSADAQLLLRATAVVAEPAGEQVLAAVAGMDLGRARAGLSEVLGCGLLAEDTRGLMGFRHALAARAVYEATPGPDRRAAHLRAGQALADQVPPPVAALARHFREGEDTGLWLRYAEEAASLATAAGDDATAATLLHDLITAAGLSARTVVRLAGKIVLLALPANGQLAGLAGALRAALGSASLAPAEEAELRFQLGRVLSTMNEVDASREELERAVAGLPPGSLSAVRAMTLLGWPHGNDCPARDHLRWLRRASETAPSVLPAERLRLLVDRATALLLLGEPTGWAEAAQVPWDAPASRERLQVTRGHGNFGEAAMVWGRYAEARNRLEYAAGVASSYHYTRIRDAALTTLAHLDWLTGAWDGLAGRAAELAGDEDLHPIPRLEAVLVTGLVAAAAGDRERAVQFLERVIEGVRRRGAVEYLMEPAAALARLHLATGNVTQALKVTEEPVGVMVGKGIWIWTADLAPARVTALAAVGRTSEAEALASAFTRGLHSRDAPASKADLVLCRAILAEAVREPTRAAALFARAAAAWDALPRPYGALLARERQAYCLLAAGRRDAGLPLLEEVLRGLSGLGASGDTARVVRVLREHGVQARRSVPGRPSYGNQLSPRELEVVRLLVAGRASRDIASELFLSPKTVARHLGSAMRKTGTTTPAALAARALDAGIIPIGTTEFSASPVPR